MATAAKKKKECKHEGLWQPFSYQVVVDMGQSITRHTIDTVFCPTCLVVKRFEEVREAMLELYA